jgi:hypothetical protein
VAAEARRPRAAALAAIVLPLNGVKPALLHASFSQFVPLYPHQMLQFFRLLLSACP